MTRGFILGAVTGGVIALLWRDEILGFLTRRTRHARSRAADKLHAVEEAAEHLLDHAKRPFQRAEEFLDETKARISTGLRSGEEAIRPSPEEK